MAGILASLCDQRTITQYWDYVFLVRKLDELVVAGQAKRIPVIKSNKIGDIPGEWFQDVETLESTVCLIPTNEAHLGGKKSMFLSCSNRATKVSPQRRRRIKARRNDMVVGAIPQCTAYVTRNFGGEWDSNPRENVHSGWRKS